MKSLTKKNATASNAAPKKGTQKQLGKQLTATVQTTRTEAQCCAKVAKTVAGCHD